MSFLWTKDTGLGGSFLRGLALMAFVVLSSNPALAQTYPGPGSEAIDCTVTGVALQDVLDALPRWVDPDTYPGGIRIVLNGPCAPRLDPSNGDFLPFEAVGFQSRLEIRGGSNPTVMYDQPGVLGVASDATCSGGPPGRSRTFIAERSPDVRLRNVILRGGNGVQALDSGLTLIGSTVENSYFSGIVSVGDAGSDAFSFSSTSRNNCVYGMYASRGSRIGSSTNSSISGNRLAGLFGDEGSRIDLRGNTVVEQNGAVGVVVRQGAFGRISGNAVVQANGATNPFTHAALNQFEGGVYAYLGSTLVIEGPSDPATGLPEPGGPSILNNRGPGVTVDFNSSAVLFNTVVQGNEGGGVQAIHAGVLEVQEAVTSLGNATFDLDCDALSVVFGDFGGVGQQKCSNAKK